MIIETKINLKNKTKEELIDLVNESLEIINKQNADKQKLIEKLEEDKNNLEFSRDLDADKGFGEDEEDMAVRIYIEEILKILKGESDRRY